MQNLKLRLVALTIACAAFACTTPASAQNARSWVSSTGADGNSCLRAAPCATFGGALAKTAIGGLISCADPGDYGTPTITQTVTIDCPEGFGNVSGIVINIPTSSPNDASRTVTLRGLAILGNGSLPLAGIEVLASGTVNIDHVHLYGGFTRGVYDHRSDTSGRLLVRNSMVENNTLGVVIVSPGIVQAVLDNVQASGNTYGLAVGARTSVAVRDSVFSGNTIGLEGDTNAQIAVERSIVSHNSTGIESNFSVRLSNSDVSFNATGVQGTAATFGNNRFSANGNDGTLTPVGSASSDLGQR
jgi:hypothetical protein